MIVRINIAVLPAAVRTNRFIVAGGGSACMDMLSNVNVTVGGKLVHFLITERHFGIIRRFCVCLKMHGSGTVPVGVVHFELCQCSVVRSDGERSFYCCAAGQIP